MSVTASIISPSREARQLFNSIVARADGRRVLTYDRATSMIAERKSQGHNNDQQLVSELRAEGWIETSPEGGVVITLINKKRKQ